MVRNIRTYQGGNVVRGAIPVPFMGGVRLVDCDDVRLHFGPKYTA